jgi:hypothetical protein
VPALVKQILVQAIELAQLADVPVPRDGRPAAFGGGERQLPAVLSG